MQNETQRRMWKNVTNTPGAFSFNPLKDDSAGIILVTTVFWLGRTPELLKSPLATLAYFNTVYEWKLA